MKLRDDSFNPSCGWKMTSAQVVETSVTNNSSFQNYPHPGQSHYTNYCQQSNVSFFTVLGYSSSSINNSIVLSKDTNKHK